MLFQVRCLKWLNLCNIVDRSRALAIVENETDKEPYFSRKRLPRFRVFFVGKVSGNLDLFLILRYICSSA